MLTEHITSGDGSLEMLEANAIRPGSGNNYGGQTPNPYGINSSGRTPAPAGGRTPAWNMDSSRTPWGASGKTPDPSLMGRTPNHHDFGGKTPAWGTVSRTPNPYAQSGKTPEWNTSAPTPNPYAASYNAYGSQTPRPPEDDGQAGGRSTWGGATPGHHTSWGDSSSSWVCGHLPSPPRYTHNISLGRDRCAYACLGCSHTCCWCSHTRAFMVSSHAWCL